MTPLSSSRPRCPQCTRALEGCWCGCVRPVDNPVPLLILQHPDEVHQAKNTASLLHRCLSRSRLQVGERFEPPASTTGMALLYPDTPGDVAMPAAAAWPDTPIHTLIAVDATWRKSRRMLYLNPWLATLPRLSLHTTPPSRYAIRRAHQDDQCSTLEACALALAQLDGHGDGDGDPDDLHARINLRYVPLWDAMDDFVNLQRRLLREGRARRTHEADRSE